MAILYCAVSDLYAFGVPRGGAPNPARLAASVDATANTIELDVHGFGDDDPIVFRAEAGGTLPSPLQANTTYYAIPVTEGTFSVAASAGGAAIDLTTTGGRFVVIAPLPTEAAIDFASRVIDDMLPPHVVPLTAPVPPIIRMTAAEIAAFKLVGVQGSQSKTLTDIMAAAEKRLARWATGVPIRGENAPRRANLSVSSTVRSDPRGWARYGGTE